MSWQTVVENILIGVGSGIIFGLLGYLKSAGEKFDVKKFTQTLVVSAVVGGIGGYLGMSPEEAQEYLQTAGLYGGITTLVEYVKKSILKRLGG